MWRHKQTVVSIIWTWELILSLEWTTLSWWWETNTVYMCEVWLGESGTYLEMQFSLSVITRYFSQLQLRARSNLSLPTNNNHIIHSVFGRVGRLVSSQSVRVSECLDLKCKLTGSRLGLSFVFIWSRPILAGGLWLVATSSPDLIWCSYWLLMNCRIWWGELLMIL